MTAARVGVRRDGARDHRADLGGRGAALRRGARARLRRAPRPLRPRRGRPRPARRRRLRARPQGPRPLRLRPRADRGLRGRRRRRPHGRGVGARRPPRPARRHDRPLDGRHDRRPLRATARRRPHRPRPLRPGPRPLARGGRAAPLDEMPDATIDTSTLSRDPAVGKAYTEDPRLARPLQEAHDQGPGHDPAPHQRGGSRAHSRPSTCTARQTNSSAPPTHASASRRSEARTSPSASTRTPATRSSTKRTATRS